MDHTPGMSANLEVIESAAGSDATSLYSDDESSEDIMASFWRQYSVKYAPVYSLKVKNRYWIWTSAAHGTQLAGAKHVKVACLSADATSCTHCACFKAHCNPTPGSLT